MTLTLLRELRLANLYDSFGTYVTSKKSIETADQIQKKASQDKMSLILGPHFTLQNSIKNWK